MELMCTGNTSNGTDQSMLIAEPGPGHVVLIHPLQVTCSIMKIKYFIVLREDDYQEITEFNKRRKIVLAPHPSFLLVRITKV